MHMSIRRDQWEGAKGYSFKQPLWLVGLLREYRISPIEFLLGLLALLGSFISFLIQVGLGRVFAFGIVGLACDFLCGLGHNDLLSNSYDAQIVAMVGWIIEGWLIVVCEWGG